MNILSVIKKTIVAGFLLLVMLSFFVVPTNAQSKEQIACEQAKKIWVTIAIDGKHCLDKGDPKNIQTNPIWRWALAIIKFLSAGVGIAVAGGIVWGGLLYMTVQGNSAQTQKAVHVIVNSVLGLILYIGMFAIINFLIPGGGASIVRRFIASLALALGLMQIWAAPVVALSTPLTNFAACKGGSAFFGFPSWDACLKHDKDGEVQISRLEDVWLIILPLLESVIKAGGYIAVGFIIWGGIQFIKSQGDPGNINNARSTILNAIIGLLLCIFSVTIVRFVADGLTR